MDMLDKPEIDRAIFDVLCLFTDLDTNSMPGQLTMQQFKEQVIEPLQHGKAHLRYSANGVLLWFFSWLALNDDDLENINNLIIKTVENRTGAKIRS